MTTPTPDKPWQAPSAPEQFAAAWVAHPSPSDLPDVTMAIPYVIDADGRPQFTPTDLPEQHYEDTVGYPWISVELNRLVMQHFQLTRYGFLTTQDDRDIAHTLETAAREIRALAAVDDANEARKAEGEGAK